MAAFKKLSVGAMKPWFPESHLGESNFTCAFLLKNLREKCEQFRELEKKYKIYNIRAKDISEGSGYLSRVFKCDIILKPEDATSSDSSFLFSVILKQPGFESIDASFQGMGEMDSEVKEKRENDMIQLITKFHHNEVTFFQLFEKTPLPIPRCYGAGDWIPEGKQSGYIIMEYLSNGKFPELHVGLNENQAMNLIKFIIKFQAIAMKNEAEWKNEFTEVNFGEASDPTFGSMCYENVKRGQSENFIKNVRKLERFFMDTEMGDYVGSGPWKTLGIHQMLIHGDLWTNNACFKYDFGNDKICDDISAIIDWQVVHEGNPLTDVSRVLLMCCNPDVRRSIEPTIIDWYFENLQNEIGDAKMPFTKEELEISKRYSDLENLLFAFFMPTIHFQGGNPQADAKRKAYMARLEALINDKMPMLEQHFGELLSTQ